MDPESKRSANESVLPSTSSAVGLAASAAATSAELGSSSRSLVTRAGNGDNWWTPPGVQRRGPDSRGELVVIVSRRWEIRHFPEQPPSKRCG